MNLLARSRRALVMGIVAARSDHVHDAGSQRRAAPNRSEGPEMPSRFPAGNKLFLVAKTEGRRRRSDLPMQRYPQYA